MGVTAEELKLLLTGDPTGAKAAIAEVIAAQEGLVTATTTANTVLNDTAAIDSVAASTVGMRKEIDQAMLSTVDWNVAVQSMTDAQLDQILATQTQTGATATMTATYGNMIFTEEAATTATAGLTMATEAFGIALSTWIPIIGAVVVATQVVVGALEDWEKAEGKKALTQETAKAKQDVINKAISEGADANITYGDAVKYVNDKEKERIALIPEAAYQQYINRINAATNAMERQKLIEDSLSMGLANHGMVAGMDADAVRKMNEEYEKSVAVTKKLREERQKLLDQQLKSVTSTEGFSTRAKTLNEMLGSFGERWDELGKGMEDQAIRTTYGIDTLDKSFKALAKDVKELPPAKEANFGDYGPTLEQAGKQAMTFSQAMDKSLISVSKTLTRVFTNGGSFKDALNGITSNIGSTLLGPNGPLGFGAGGLMNGIGNKLTSIFGAGLGAALPGIGTAIGAALPAIGQLFGKLFSSPEKQINPLRQQYIDAAGGLSELNKKAFEATGSLDLVRKLLDAKNADQYTAAIRNLNSALDASGQAEEKANQYAQELGLSIEELGPKWAAQKLTEQGGELWEKWDVLRAKGADMNAVTLKMKDSIQAYYLESKKTGTEIPEQYKLMLQRMVEMGQLTDENGDKVTDLDKAGVTFSKSMTDSVKTVVESVQKLVDALQNKLGGAIRGTSRPPWADWGTPPDLPDYGSGNGPRAAETEPLPRFSNRTMERVTGAGLAFLDPGDVVGVPRPGMFGGGITVNVGGSVWGTDDLADAMNTTIGRLLRIRYPQGVG